MHLRSLSELQGVTAQQASSTPWTTQDRASGWSSRERRDSSSCCSPLRRAPLWVWLLLGALVVPGALSFLSEEQEELLVELHNYYRGQVSPSASAMLPLKWDTNLKLVAEGYAAKCIWNHNPELEETGENLFAGTGPLDLRSALEKWFLEHLDYDFQNNSCDEEKMCGHYTQMVWADTHRVGCAFHLCDTMEGLDWDRVSFLVCNYYPAGNYEGERPYVEGDWCSRCPENLQKCENNLCVPDIVDEDDDEDETAFSSMPGEFIPDATTEPLHLKEADVPPATSNTPVQPDTTDSILNMFTTLFKLVPEDTPPPSTAAWTTKPPPAPTTKLVTLTNKISHDTKEGEKKEEDKRNETPDEAGKDVEIDFRPVVKKTNSVVQTSAASVSSPSVLLACLTGILILRL